MSKLSTTAFAAFLLERCRAKDGYIMGAIGENPQIWTEKSWRIAQYADRSKYTAKQHAQALYWWKHCERVWDCQGLADGYVTDSGEYGKVNVKARDNYASWCNPKGNGMIPAEYRVPGAAVFWQDSKSYIHHVAYLVEPVDPSKPAGDWYIIEARGVMYGVVRTRLESRKPDHWGWMTKYFDYDEATSGKDIPLHKGMKGNDVKTMQENMIRLGYSCGKYGADGDFGSATEAALIKFQENNGLEADGIYGEKTKDSVEKLLKMFDETTEDTDVPEKDWEVTVTGGSVWLWSAPPSLGGKKVKVVHKGDTFMPADNHYMPIEVNGEVLWGNVDYLSLKEK